MEPEKALTGGRATIADRASVINRYLFRQVILMGEQDVELNASLCFLKIGPREQVETNGETNGGRCQIQRQKPIEAEGLRSGSIPRERKRCQRLPEKLFEKGGGSVAIGVRKCRTARSNLNPTCTSLLGSRLDRYRSPSNESARASCEKSIATS